MTARTPPAQQPNPPRCPDYDIKKLEADVRMWKEGGYLHFHEPIECDVLLDLVEGCSRPHPAPAAEAQQRIEQVIKELKSAIERSELCYDDDAEEHANLRNVARKAIALLRGEDG